MLAINGGLPLIKHEFKQYSTLDETESKIASEVVSERILSGFLGSQGPKFLGGKHVRNFEKSAALKFDSAYCVSFNSWTSGLIAAVGCIPNLEPGDEIITTPWTMSATAMAILHWNAIPVFADIDLDTYCIDPAKIEKLITNKTKAILTVDIFGKSSDYISLRRICDKYGLILISDSAQAPGALLNGKNVHKYADIGGYSLNYHKHIQTGEGGFALTDSFEFAQKMQLIRNHAESVIDKSIVPTPQNLLGYNFRLGEIEAAIANSQLAKLDFAIDSRIEAGNRLIKGLSNLKNLYLPEISNDRSNVFYFLPMRFEPVEGISRDFLYQALLAEGVPAIQKSYVNVHRLPVFRDLKAYGSKSFPWTLVSDEFINTYGEGKCLNAEVLYDEKFLGLHMCSYVFDDVECGLIIKAFEKVWSNIFD